MAMDGRVLLLLFASFCTCLCYETLKKECQNKCELTYPSHTYPYVAYQSACKRGCRFNVILQLSVSDREPEVAEVSCEKACKEAYDDDENGEYACLFGCKQQKAIPSPTQMLQNKEDEDLYSIISFKPVFFLGSLCQGILDRTSHVVQFSSSYYYSNSDGDSVVIKYESPQMYFQGGQLETHVIVSTDQDAASSEDAKDEGDAIPYKMINHGRNWLHCVSAKSGLPAWLVAGTLLLSSFFLIWLCCATTTTTKIHAKVLTADDLFLLEEEEKKVNRIPMSLGDDPEAGPLPVKVLIDDSRI